MDEKNYETLELPGVGEIRARRGTSTLELAGAVKHWHDRAKTAYIDGFVGGSVVTALVSIAGGLAYHYLRSH